MSIEGLYDEIRSAAELDDDRAVLRITADLQPAGGAGSKVYPPTYLPAEPPAPPESHRDLAYPKGPSQYQLEFRFLDGATRRAVQLDTNPSQANRCEESLLRALRSGRVRLPLIEIVHSSETDVVISSLELPHRYADAYLKDSLLDGVSLDRTEFGKFLQGASLDDATALFQHDPGSIDFGAWNSHRKGRQQRFPRVYTSEIVGWDPEVGRRNAGRMDPLNLSGAQRSTASAEEWAYEPVATKVKGEKLSERGLGNIAPNPQHGGVTISSAQRIATLSLAALDRIGFGSASHEASVTARAALAAYALMADRLAFGAPTIWLRSGCELVVESERIEWVHRGGATTAVTITNGQAVELFAFAQQRASDAGLAMALEPVRLTPSKPLAAAIDFSLTRAAGDADE